MAQQGAFTNAISRFGITTVYSHPEASADIVLVHSLNGHPRHTWTAKISQDEEVFWPTELLPQGLVDQANILVYGYNADVKSRADDESHCQDFIFTQARELMTALAHHRKGAGTASNAIIWVAHGIGGILVKQALLSSKDLTAEGQEDLRFVYQCTYGIFFLATPHMGFDAKTWGRTVRLMSAPKHFMQLEPLLPKTLKEEVFHVRHIARQFLEISPRFKMVKASETQRTRVLFTKRFIVAAEHAAQGIPEATPMHIDANHQGICKHVNSASPGYRELETELTKWVVDAPDLIESRLAIEAREALAQFALEAELRLLRNDSP